MLIISTSLLCIAKTIYITASSKIYLYTAGRTIIGVPVLLPLELVVQAG